MRGIGGTPRTNQGAAAEVSRYQHQLANHSEIAGKGVERRKAFASASKSGTLLEISG